MTALLIAAAGWIGAACTLLAYLLLSTRRIEGHGAAFQWLNVFGGLGLAINGAANGAFPSAVLNTIWIAIGVTTLLRRRGLLSGATIAARTAGR